MVDLRERVAIVTGAGRGIGRAYALRMAAYGARVVVNDAGVATDGSATDEDPAAEVVAEIAAAGGEAVAHRGDIGDAAVGDALVALALETWGRLDIVVNNAGFGRPRMVFNLADDEWDDVIRVHLRGTFVVSRPACRHWRAQAKEHGTTYGRLINTATGLLLYGGAGQSNYVAAKAGINAFTEAIATEMAPVRRDGQRDHARREHAPRADRLAHGARDRSRRAARSRRRICATRCTSPSSAASSRHPKPRASPGQTFQVHGGTIEHVQHVARRADLAPRPTAATPPTSSPPSSRSTRPPRPPTARPPSGPPPASAPIAGDTIRWSFDAGVDDRSMVTLSGRYWLEGAGGEVAVVDGAVGQARDHGVADAHDLGAPRRGASW